MGSPVYVARQPILTASGDVFGYELLYRATGQAQACVASPDLAAASVLTDALLAIGLDNIRSGHLAFLNLTRSLVLQDIGTLVQPASVVLEVLETVTVDADVVAACRALHARGYAIALDDFVAGSDAEALLPYARFLKVDVMQTPAPDVRAIAARWSGHGLRLLAEKVETREVFEETKAHGYSLFQGYYFCRPKIVATHTVPAPRQLAYLRLMSALRDPDLSMRELESLVKHDVSISYRVLRLVNSAGFGIPRQVGALREALILVGTRTIATWVTVWALAGLNTAPSEVATLAMMRARACEVLGNVLDGQGDRLFLLGLCSMLDTMLGLPMSNALESLPLATEIQAALLGAPGTERSLLDAVIAYERGEWAEAERIASGLGLAVRSLPEAYGQALRWTTSVTHDAERKAS